MSSDYKDSSHVSEDGEIRDLRKKIDTNVENFLNERDEPILSKRFDEEGFYFETKLGKYFIPAYSFEVVNDNIEIIADDGVDWKMESQGYVEDRFFVGEITHKGHPIKLFRKYSKTSERQNDISYGFTLQESINSVHLGAGESVSVDDHVSFRVPKHYATTHSSVIMEYVDLPLAVAVVNEYEDQNSNNAQIIKDAHRKLRRFLAKDEYGGGAFRITSEPTSERYGAGAALRAIYVESFNEETGEITFLVTDLKNRFDDVPWDKTQ